MFPFRTSAPIDAIIRLDLGRRLKAQGFQRRGWNFCKRQGEGIVCVTVQATERREVDRRHMTIGLGMYYPEADRMLRGWEPLTFPTTRRCPAALRVGLPVLAHGEDRWWSLVATTPSECAALGREIGEMWDAFGIGWATELSTLAAGRARCVARGDHVTAAALALLMGKRDEAIAHARQALAAAAEIPDEDALRRDRPSLRGDRRRLLNMISEARRARKAYLAEVRAFAARQRMCL